MNAGEAGKVCERVRTIRVRRGGASRQLANQPEAPGAA
jgi:hypothetical protein